jgi:protein SCO1
VNQCGRGLSTPTGDFNQSFRGGRGDEVFPPFVCATVISMILAVSAFALSPDELKRVGFDQHVGQQISRDLIFRDATGQLVSLGDYLEKKPTLLVLGYYHCPMLCTLINDGLIQSLQELRGDIGKEFNVVNVSIDPNENPSAAAAKKKEYLTRYGRPGAADGWSFLTGDRGAIAQLANETGFRFVYDPVSHEYAHPSGFILLMPGGEISRYFFGVNFNPKELREAIIAASHGERGSVITQLILLCYHYNPITGKYGALIMNVLRACGVATVLVVGVLIFFLVGRDRRARRSVEALVPAAFEKSPSNGPAVRP